MARRTRLLAALATAGALGIPSDALADKTFRGKTQQDRTITLTVGDDGLVRTLRVNWITRRCARRGSRFQSITGFRAPFDAATPDAFEDAGAYTVRDSGRVRSRVRIAITGRRTFDPANPAYERWRGTVRARIVVRRAGRVIDRCRLREIRWSAGLESVVTP